jgi:hypothetical protein
MFFFLSFLLLQRTKKAQIPTFCRCGKWTQIILWCLFYAWYTSASYLDLQLEIDSEGQLRMKLYDKRDDFNFPVVNFPFVCSNIPAAPAYGVYISQMIRYSRACGSYRDFLDRGLLLTRKLLNQEFLLVKLKSSLRKFYLTWLTAMEYLCHKWPRMCSTCRKHFPVLSSFMTYHRVCN